MPSPSPRTFSVRAAGALVALLAGFGPQTASCTPNTGSEPTLRIEKALPEGTKTVNAPDTDHKHYRTLDGTHFSYRCRTPYTTRSRQAAVDVCEIDPVHLQILNWPETEIINIVKGQVTVTERDGTIKTYAEGDIFVLPKGFKGAWYQTEKLLKVVARHPLYWKD